MTPIRSFLAAAALLLLMLTGAKCLKNVQLEIIPKKVVDYGSSVILRCNYELSPDDKPIESIHWYFGIDNIYTFSADEKSKNTKWHYQRNLTWDEYNSSNTQVALRNMKFEDSGNYSCEVTTEFPDFYRMRSFKTLNVVSLPKDNPVMKSEKPRYKVGDTLRVNCTSPISTPRAEMSFTLNNEKIDDEHVNHEEVYEKDYYAVSRTRGHQFSSQHMFAEVSLYLSQFHFKNGELNLRCSIKIPKIDYEAFSEIQLGKTSDPKLARVTSMNASFNCNRVSDLMIVGLILLHLQLR